MIAENAGSEQTKYPAQRFAEIINRPVEDDDDTRTCGEIVTDMWERINGKGADDVTS